MSFGFPFQAKSKSIRPRLAPRHAAVGLRCHLGDIVDLSSTGLRLRRLGKPQITVGTVLPILLQNESQSVRVNARVVWVRKVGGLTSNEWQVGAHFQDVKDGIKNALEQFAMFGCIQTTPSEWGGHAAQEPVASASGAKAGPHSHSATQGTNTDSAPRHPRESAGGTVRGEVIIENLYALLGVAPTAHDAVIRAAYHAMAKQLHPDQCKDIDAAEKFAMVNKAYSVLRDGEARKRYDEMLRQAAA